MKKLLVLSIFSAVLVSGCGGTVSIDNPAPSPYPAGVPQSITIDSANVIPVINGSSTNGYIKVHNNTNYAISNIVYEATTNSYEGMKSDGTLQKMIFKLKSMVGLKGFSNTFLDPTSAALCKQIPANGVCTLKFSTPALSSNEFQASAQVTANYTDKNSAGVASQTFNMQYIQLNSGTHGIKFLGNSNLYYYGNQQAYTSLYYYVNGTPGDIYELDSVMASAGLKVTNQQQPGFKVASGYVGVINLAANGPVSGASQSLVNVQYSLANTNVTNSLRNVSLKSNNLTSSGIVNITPMVPGPMLISGFIPLTNINVTTQGIMYLTNVGSSVAKLGNISYGSGLAAGSTNTCGSSLAANSSCAVYFNITSTSQGTSSITVPYGNYSVVQPVSWYVAGGPIITTSANPTSLSFLVGNSESYIVTLGNVGNTALKNLIQTPTTLPGGSAVPTTLNALSCLESDGITPSGNNLLPSGSCTYTINVTDSVVESGQNIMNTISGIYGVNSSSYVAKIVVPYASRSNIASIMVTPLTPSGDNNIIVNGDGVSTTITTMQVTNISYVPTTIESVTSYGDTNYINLESDDCSGVTLAPLPAESSCTYSIILGPYNNESTTNITGIESSVVAFSGAGITGESSITTFLNYTITGVMKLVMTSITANGTPMPAGNGTVGNPFMESGYVTGSTVTLTMENQGIDPNLTITGIQDTNSPMAWVLNRSSSTCVSSIGTPIAIGSTCTLVYDYVYNSNSIITGGGTSGTTSQDISTPIITLTSTGAQFMGQVVVPSTVGTEGTFIYANSNLATLVNTAAIAGTGANESFTITTTLTNANGYSAMTENVYVANVQYFNGVPATINCGPTSVDPSGSVYIQNCTLGSSSSSAVYSVNNLYAGATIAAWFAPNTNGQGLSINTMYFNGLITP
ncbi:MAG: hypothetical protein PHC75_06725 [Burkholderiales bacterium]|nr:hypothetical protein [Burkholderiales bacterium]